MPQILEAIMVVLFGSSWPISIVKSYKAKTAQGKSRTFMILIFIGCCSGIAAKIIGHSVNYVCIFYMINAFMVSIDIFLHIRNSALDRQARQAGQSA